MNDLEITLRAVLSDPESDTPRLVYADLLDREGDHARAEFIRVQIELAAACTPHQLANLDGIDVYLDPDDSEQQDWKHKVLALRRRKRVLLHNNFGLWTDFLPESLVTQPCPNCEDQAPDYETNVVECGCCECTGLVENRDNVEFTRGFISRISCSWKEFCAVERSLIWLPGRMERCPAEGYGPGVRHNLCDLCNETGRALVPFVQTFQPIEQIDLTTPMGIHEVRGDKLMTDAGYFHNLKCPACQGSGWILDHDYPQERCLGCTDGRSALWVSPLFPKVKFTMPRPR